jgi:hypothetical protein
LLRFQPFLSLVVLAFGAVTIAAGMVTVLYLAAFGAGLHLPAQGLGAVLLDGAHGLPVTGEKLVSVFRAIGRTVLAKEISQF